MDYNTGRVLKMEHLMGVKEENTEILGKFLYFSLSNILIERETLAQICDDMGLPVKPGARLGITDAFKSATGDIYERLVNKESGELRISKIYCRDNQKANDIYSRELIKETLGEKTNRYKKLANMLFNKDTGRLDYTIDSFDSGLDVSGYCEKALELYELYRICAGRNQIENMTDNFLNQIRTHKSYLVNCHYVRYLEYRKVELDNGTELPVAQSKYKPAIDLLTLFAEGEPLE